MGALEGRVKQLGVGRAGQAAGLERRVKKLGVGRAYQTAGRGRPCQTGPNLVPTSVAIIYNGCCTNFQR